MIKKFTFLLVFFFLSLLILSSHLNAQCSVSIQNLTTNFGNPGNNNTYSLSGTLTFSNPPSSGVLSIRVQGGSSVFFSPPFNSPINFLVEGLYADGEDRTVEAEFSDNTGCNDSESYTAPNTTLPNPKLPLDYRAPNLNISSFKGENIGFVLPGTTSTATFSASVFDLNISDQNMVEYAAFCIELEESIQLNVNTYNDEYVVAPLENATRGQAGIGASVNIPADGIGRVKAGIIRYLFDNFYLGTSETDYSNNEAAAFQMALWDISHDHYDGTDYTVTSGASSSNFFAPTSSAARTLAQDILDVINGLNWTDRQWESYATEVWHPIFLESATITTDPSQQLQDLIVGIPLEQEFETSDETSLIVTEGSCWRMFSSPFQTKRTFTDDVPDPGSVTDFTYNDFVGPWWTQGPTGSQNPDLNASNANIFVWPLDAAGNNDTDWSIDFGTNGLNEQVTAARGFLMSVYADDDPSDGIDNTWPTGDKERNFEYIDEDVWGYDSGNPGVSSDISAPMNTTSDGWSLIGNPYDEAVSFSALTTSNITGVAYIYDRNLNSSVSDAPTNGNSGGWRATSTPVGGFTYGDITNGIIEPFQGFFVQNNGAVGSVTFTDASKQGVGEFYGKEKERSFARLELQGEGLFNSAWVAFDTDANFDQMYGDAFELNPFTEQYALLGTRKGDDMFDIGQFPMEDGTEIPLAVETTLTGEYTLSATDFELPAGMELVFVDNENDLRLPVTEDFSYTFTLNGMQQKGLGMDALPCGATQQQIADFFKPTKSKVTGETRFALIVNPDGSLNENELPGGIQLEQNYPNPFNPTTQITYQLPQASDVQLAIYDMTGRQVTTLINERVSSGTHTISFNASDLSSGVYLYRLQAGTTVLTKKLTLIK